MDKWDRHNQWMKETRLAEGKLRKRIRQYINLGLCDVRLDRSFTPEDLRDIADVAEKRINADAWKEN